ncbi:unnamed protein product [Darwinula stevensoni]|uniref:Ataxin-10 n=1 Tax=Darwinula stevensoni TaxID=69355 RepID=A0A7R9A0S9_9CRUS|nr:unnamed protein product [Darwinula stevensoni]CAG0881893.1 unnamed protein product [Darwinula stevensoni]
MDSTVAVIQVDYVMLKWSVLSSSLEKAADLIQQKIPMYNSMKEILCQMRDGIPSVKVQSPAHNILQACVPSLSQIIHHLVDQSETSDKILIMRALHVLGNLCALSSDVHEAVYNALEDLFLDLMKFNDGKIFEGCAMLINTLCRRSSLILDCILARPDFPDILTQEILRIEKGDEGSHMQADPGLLIKATCILKSIHEAGKEGHRFFAPVLSSSDSCQDSLSSPTIHLKSFLIQLIGNLVHQHKKNQDLVREGEGIPVLLECCNLDHRNPYITQWSVLALRNLCEGNADNQRIINDLSYLGPAPDSLSIHDGILRIPKNT